LILDHYRRGTDCLRVKQPDLVVVVTGVRWRRTFRAVILAIQKAIGPDHQISGEAASA
jgi:hypothetical protein